MPVEVTMLAWASIILFVQFALMEVAMNMQLGPAWTTGPRDSPRELHGMAGRLKRAFENMLEGLMMFTAAVVVVTLGDAATANTALAAKVFVVARIAYVPAYVIAVPLLRSVIWSIGFSACVFMIVQALV